MKFSRLTSLILSLIMVIGLLPVTVTGAEISAEDLLLYPAPRNLISDSGVYTLTDGSIESDDQTLKAISKIQSDAKEFAEVDLSKDSNPVVFIIKDESLNEQGYSLKIDQNGITIRYKDEPGSYYAATTLYQILWQTGKSLPYITIENDYPDFKYRGFELDTSRNRIPRMEKMKKLMDIMSNLKYNQFFLYTHRYSYAYESYPEAWEDSVPITAEYVAELTKYANNRGIDVIPAQNYLGKNDRVLALYPQLGDTPTGKELNLFLPETKEYLSNITDDVYDGYTSDFMQAGCDEVNFDAINGTVAKSWKELNPGKEPTNTDLYFSSLEEIYKLLSQKGKKMMYYGDMTVKFSQYERAKETMPDAIAMNWCYYAEKRGLDRFDYSSKGFHDAGIPFYVCPGDQAWSTIVGDIDVMVGNAENAAIKGKQYEAIGYCTTHWGDGGCYQNIISSYPGVAYAGAMSWHNDTNIEGINSYDEFLNMFVYQDKTNTVSQGYTGIADYKKSSGLTGDIPKILMTDKWDSNTSASYLWKAMDANADNTITAEERDSFIEKCQMVSKNVEEFLILLSNSDMQADDGDLLYKEMKNTAQTLKITVDYAALRAKVFTGSEIEKPLSAFYEIADDLIENAKELNEVIEDFRYIWGERDMLNGQNSTMYQFKNAYDFFKSKLGIRNIFDIKNNNLFILTPEELGASMGATGGMAGIKTWTNSGANMPMVSVNQLGGETVETLKGAIADKVFSVKDGVFSYNTKAALTGGYFDRDANQNKLMPIIGFPAVITADGKYKFTLKAKYESGQAVTSRNVSMSGYATNVTNSVITDIGKNAEISVSQADADGWYNVTAEFDALNFEGASINLMPAKSVTEDTLYTCDYTLLCSQVTNAAISSYYDENSVVYIGTEVTVPKAFSNGSKPVSVKVKAPSGKETSLNMGDTIKVDEAGNYTFTYTAEDVKTPLVITVKSAYVYQDLLDYVNKIEGMDLTPYTNRSVKALTEEVAKAKELIADPDAEKEDYDMALVDLKRARNSLELKRAVVTESMMTITSNMTPYAKWGCVLTGIVDGDAETFTTFENYQDVGNYIQFEFKNPVILDGVRFVNHATYKPLFYGDFQVSANGQDWQTIGSVTDGEALEKDFTPTEVKYARIICTKIKREWWTMNEVVLYYQRPKTVDDNGYIIAGMTVNKAMTDDIHKNSYDGTSWSADKMIDGDVNTMGANTHYYATAGAGARALTVIDLGGEYELKSVEITLPDGQQIAEAFNTVSPDSTYKLMNGNGSGIYVSNSVPVRADFEDFNVSPSCTATDLVRLEIGSNSLDIGPWDPENRTVCNKLNEGDTYRYLSILTPYSGGHAISEIKVKVVADDEIIVTKEPVTINQAEFSGTSVQVKGTVSGELLSETGQIIVALYNDNILEKVYTTDIKETIEHEFKDITAGTDYTIRFFCWTSKNNSEPLTKPVFAQVR